MTEPSESEGLRGLGGDARFTTLYLRRRFEVDDDELPKRAWLHTRMSDGFVAYINGAEVARFRAKTKTVSEPKSS